MAHAFPLKTGGIGEKCYHIRGRETDISLLIGLLFIGRHHAQRSDRRRMMTGHPPQLPCQFDGRCLAIGASDSNANLGKGCEEFRSKLSKGTPRFFIGNPGNTLDKCVGS